MAQVTVLVVDDHAENLLALEEILRPLNYRLLLARSGKEALQIALREKVTVALLDVVMPEMDGFEVAQFLKQTERTRSIPIIFMTALATDATHVYRAYEVGAADYLITPLDPAVVRRKVAIFVELVLQREQIARHGERLREVERREYEIRLEGLRAASLQRYRKLIEGIDHAIAWSADDTPRLTFISAKAESILGFPTSAFISPDFWGQHLHPDDRQAVLAAFDEVLRDGVDRTIHHRIVTADGRALWFLTGLAREVSERGQREIHAVSMEVTEIKRAEATQAMLADVGAILSETLDYAASLPKVAARLVPHLADFCLVDELNGAGRLCERAAVHTDPAREALLRRLERQALDAQAAALVGRVARSGKAELVTDVPDERWLAEAIGAKRIEPLRQLRARSCMFVPLSGRGNALGVITLVSSGARRLGPSDLALAEEVGRRAGMAMENARLYQEAEEARQAREELLAVVSHDLRTPLNSIVISADMLNKTSAGEHVKYSRSISRAAERMEHLICDLLDLAQLQSGALTIKRKVTDGASLIRDTMEVLKPIAEEKKLRLETQGEGDEVRVFCDRGRILQVLSNLVGNAVRFTPEGGSVSVRLARSGREAEFTVTDTGPGIPAAEIAHIWERFWRGAERAAGGVGLGLSIAKGLVEAHGGRIWAQSKVGAGTTISFTLPLEDAESPTRPDEPEAGSPKPSVRIH
jgi:PAS domain S-box-containing protein